ncbi:hypothetical protein ARMSODRAFT_725790 [Armillaria solidipes]|uniref:Uncharacterized protein n=1 Tax=Armillaria solidipes TaxID=1076256 RepID=A0A2H3AP25_9AGAR|nr:hypothetical protein ARMSODRAFT_725790 [Armillaria solidipes]
MLSEGTPTDDPWITTTFIDQGTLSKRTLTLEQPTRHAIITSLAEVYYGMFVSRSRMCANTGSIYRREQLVQSWFCTDDNRNVKSRSGYFVGHSRRIILSSRAERRSGLLHECPFLSDLTSF